ncbi:uncharacterized protein LOC119110163 [Pollicipes pollicipes]|uniref:uncharacterized protein LOC119110163 n=1 Tax=Pollicipes pollicipes TaxID=41117 RepID=UPI001884BDF9|nr:uncharacterized protein LOC119110163 [Pollicipes pollicipes]
MGNGISHLPHPPKLRRVEAGASVGIGQVPLAPELSDPSSSTALQRTVRLPSAVSSSSKFSAPWAGADWCSSMLCLSVLLLCCVGRAVAAPTFGVQPDYEAAILSLGELHHQGGPARRRTEETSELQQRREQAQKRLRVIQVQILHMLNLPCVPRPPTSTNATDYARALYNRMKMMQNQTGLARDDLLRRSQSFYPSCDVPGGLEDGFWQQEDSMDVYFNLSSFLAQGQDTTIDIAELRLHKRIRRYGAPSNQLEDANDEKIRVSVYTHGSTSETAYHVPPASTAPSAAGREFNDSQLVDSVMITKYGRQWVTFNVRSAVHAWTGGDMILGLRVTVEDVNGSLLPAEDFFENMDCSGNILSNTPVPGYLLKLVKESSQFTFPVLDLRTTEQADIQSPLPSSPSPAPCPYPSGPHAFDDSFQQPRYMVGERQLATSSNQLERPRRR